MNTIYNIEFNCDVCGGSDTKILESFRKFHTEPPYQVCKDCGLIYLKHRRSAQAIADSWSNELYGDVYTALIPAVKARQLYTADYIDTTVGLAGKSLCDIGGGEGQFLAMARDQYQADVFAIEPSAPNCKTMDRLGIVNFPGTIENFTASGSFKDRKFDVVTIMWTLEACQSAKGMMEAAARILAPDGHVFVATGSRILVPFKKPLHFFLQNHGDIRPYHFSANSLCSLVAACGLQPEHINRYIDTDYLVVGARNTDKSKKIEWDSDDYTEVMDFCDRWLEDTTRFYMDYKP